MSKIMSNLKMIITNDYLTDDYHNQYYTGPEEPGRPEEWVGGLISIANGKKSWAR